MYQNGTPEYYAPIVACWKGEGGHLEVVRGNADVGCYAEASGRTFFMSVDGGAVVGDRLVRDEQDMADLCKSKDWPKSLDKDMMHARGSICLYFVDEKRSHAHIHPDPLGACLCYKFDDEEVTAYSTDLRHLVDWLTSIGKCPASSTFYFAMVLSIGNGAYGHSSYENISVLPAHIYITIKNGLAEEKSYKVDEYLRDNNESYEDLLSIAEEEILSNIRAIVKTPQKHRVAHITGGFDTRLVLSAILAEGVKDEFTFMCSGPKGSIDTDTAHGLALKYNLTMTSFSGLETHQVPENQEEKDLWGLEYSSGMRLNCVVNDGNKKLPCSMIVSGGYGECIRSFYSQNISESVHPDEVAGIQWGSALSFRNNDNSLTKPIVAERIAKETGEYLKEKLNKGWSMHQALDLMYMEQRNRYHIGNIATLISRKTLRIDPLYSLAAIKAALHVGVELRQLNKVGLDLMSRMTPDLISQKFGGKKFSEKAYQLYPKLNSEELPRGKPRYDQYKGVKKVTNRERSVTKEDIDKANRIKGSVWQVQRLENAQSSCMDLLEKDNSIFEYINKKPVFRMLSSDLNNRVHIRRVHMLNLILRFMQGG